MNKKGLVLNHSDNFTEQQSQTKKAIHKTIFWRTFAPCLSFA